MNIPEHMQALIAHGPDDYRLMQVPVPTPGPHDLLIRVEACGICAGDLKAQQQAARFWGGDDMPGYCEPPFIPGHEIVGHVVWAGELAGEFQPGDRVVSEQIVPCGACRYCRDGRYWLCDPHNVYGFKASLPGGMAEYMILPKNSRNYIIPEELPLRRAALIEPFACSLHAVRRGRITVDHAVVLAGAGTLGLGMVGAIRQRNPKQFIVLDLDERRLALARSFGADVTINPKKEDAVARVMALTDGTGCDVYIDATGHAPSVGQGLAMICKGGTFVELSVFSSPATVDWSIIGDTKEITIYGSQLSPYCYAPTMEGIVSGTIPTDGVITHEFPLSAWREAFNTARSGDAIKVIIRP